MNTTVPKATVFLLEQDTATTHTISEICEGQQLGLKSFESTRSLIQALGSEQPFILITSSTTENTDRNLESLQDIRAAQQDLPIVVLGDPSDLNGAVTAIKAGAIDYIEKPVISGRLREHFRQLIRS